jgi:hypothetical protein
MIQPDRWAVAGDVGFVRPIDNKYFLSGVFLGDLEFVDKLIRYNSIT